MFKKINKTIYIEGMHCEGCRKRVENVLSTIPEVKKVSVSLEEKKATLTLSQDVSFHLLKEKIESLGFQLRS